MKGFEHEKLTPMMKQYAAIKAEFQDYILFYRLGDFYEMFFDDAVLAAKVLEITLTARNCGLEEKAPLCGVPYHSAEGYIKKLVEKGYKVAICEQTEDPATAKGLVKREVVRVVTPGTITDPEMLQAEENNYIAAFHQIGEQFGFAYCDITTGIFKVTDQLDQHALLDELMKVMPKEIIAAEGAVFSEAIEAMIHQLQLSVSYHRAHAFSSHASEEMILRLFNILSVESLGYIEREQALCVSGGLLAYIEETARVPMKHISRIHLYNPSGYMVLDQFTRRNLELTQTMRSKEKRGSLIWVLDKTSTSMGARKLKQWIEEPLLNVHDIQSRLEVVSLLKDDLMMRSALSTLLKQVYDLERLASKLVYGNINPRDLVALNQSVAVLPDIKAMISPFDFGDFTKILEELDELKEVSEIISQSIGEDPPVHLKDGGVIRQGFHEELDTLRSYVTNGKQWILDLEKREKERLGIKHLKIGYNKVFGYYLEISKAHTQYAPEDYIRKQTLANAERYITPELKTLEEKVLGSEEKMIRLEQELFALVKEKLQRHLPRLQETASAIASLDVLTSFAEVSYRYGFMRPVVKDKEGIVIQKGRHPVVERIFNHIPFVPNDTHLNCRDNQFYIITGPNMAGKSTYLRQVALITLMAQIGCFVPADSAEIGLVDRIFTRVGASDDLSQGQSTFMVEMNELANILNNATPRSLIILDEIGRGTSTYDGLSIAWSVVEYIAERSGIHAKTLFATHYHELTELEGRIRGVKNYRIAVKEQADDIVFLRKIEPGGANQSYGIQVAKLAGVPKPVLTRAKEILAKLEIYDINNNIELLKESQDIPEQGNESLKTTAKLSAPDPVLEMIKKIDIDQLTPIEALNQLHQIVEVVRQKES